MRTIETTAVVTPDHTITVQLPEDIPPGEYQLVVVMANGQHPRAMFDWASWPAYDVQLVDPNCTFRREDMYGDGGR